MSEFHMVVCVKAVPGSTEVKMDPKTNTIVRDGKQAVISRSMQALWNARCRSRMTLSALAWMCA